MDRYKQLIILITSICLIASILNAEGIYTLQFNKNDLSFGKIDGYDIINIKGCIPHGETGFPLLPYKRIEILIPSNKRFIGIQVLNKISEQLSSSFTIYPTQPPVPLNGNLIAREIKVNEEIYASSNPVPENCIIYSEEERISGNKIITFDVIPLLYIPKDKKLILIKKITFQVLLEESNEPVNYPTKRTALSQYFVNETIKKRIFNKGEFDSRICLSEVEKYNSNNPPEELTKPSSGDLPKDFLVITSDDLSQSFENLTKMKRKRGLITSIITTTWIESNYPGRDLPERIRNFIKDAYMHWGVSWVLIGGDVTIVPTRFAQFKSWEYNGRVPTDLYYSDLDGDWDNNGNGIFCECLYGSNVDSVDGNPDIFVGRIPVEACNEVDNYIDRIICYEDNPDSVYIPKALFLGASIYSGGTDGWGAIKSEYLIENYIPSHIMPYKLYAPQIDTFQTPPRWVGDEELNRINTISNINQGYNIINHIDHGAYDAIGTGVLSGGDYFHWYDADALTNSTKPSILWSISCSPNAFDMNSVSEHFVNSPGGLAFIGNSRTGWTSQMFQDYAFFESIFSDSITNLGAAFASTLYNSLYYRVSMNLLGDPSVYVWTDIPEILDVSYEKTLIVPVDSLHFSVSKGGLPLTNARVVLTKDNENITRIALTDNSGKATIYLKCNTPGTVNISVSSPNAFPYFDSTSVLPPEEPYLSVIREKKVVRVGSKHKLHIIVKNTGGTTSERVQAIVSSSDPYVTICDSLLKFGDIPPTSSKTSNNFFTIKIKENCPPNREIPVNCNIFDRNNNVWIDTLLLYSGNDSLAYKGHSPLVIKSVSNIENPLSSIQIPSISLKNYGDFTAKDIIVHLRSTDSLISVIDSTVYIDSIPINVETNTTEGFIFNSYCGLNADFTLEIKDKFGNISISEIEFSPPSSVDSLSSASKQSSIKIAWKKSNDNDLLGYNLYREENGNWIRITEEPITYISYEDFSIKPGNNYTYSVAAVDSSYNESSLSESITTSSNPPILPGWPRYIGPGGIRNYNGKRFYDMSSPAYGDIDGDGKCEIVVGSNDNKIYTFNDDGSTVTGWPKDIGFKIENSPALCDLDGDGCDEIILGGGIFDSVSVYIFNGDGTIFMPDNWPKKDGDYSFSSPVVADIDKDGEYEIGIGCNDNKVYFWRTDGSIVDGWPVTVIKPICLAIADIDNDSLEDIVVASSNGPIYVFDSNGNQKTGWPQTPGGQIYSGLSLADLDEDGSVEIIVGTSNKKVFVYLSDGTMKPGWPCSVGNRIGGIPAIGDVDGNPGLEIAVSTISNQAYVFNNSGDLMFSVDEENQASNYYISPLLVDLNSDGKKELLISNLEGIFFIYDFTGSYITGYPLFYGNGSYASPSVGDINSDGSLDLILKGSDKKMYVWDTKKPYSAVEKWFTSRANNRNTCFYSEEVRNKIATMENGKRKLKRICFHNPFPNPFCKRVTFRFQIPDVIKQTSGDRTKKPDISFKIYDVSGRLIKNFPISNPSVSSSGSKDFQFPIFNMVWGGKDSNGMTVSSGIYFAKLSVQSKGEKFILTKKIIKLQEH